MCEMLLKVNEWEFNLAQRALDSLRERRAKKWFIKFQSNGLMCSECVDSI